MLAKIIHVISNVLSHTYIDICGPVPIYIGVFLFIIMTGVLAKTVLEAMRRKKESQKFIERFRNMWTIREVVCIALVLMAGCLSLIQFDTTTAPDLSSTIYAEDTADINTKQEILSKDDIQVERIDEREISVGSEETYGGEELNEKQHGGEELNEEHQWVNVIETILGFMCFVCIANAIYCVFAIMDEYKWAKVELCICLTGAVLFIVIFGATIRGVDKERDRIQETQTTESVSDYDLNEQIPYVLDGKIRQTEPDMSTLNIRQQDAIKTIRDITGKIMLIIAVSVAIKLLMLMVIQEYVYDIENIRFFAHITSGTVVIIFCMMFLQVGIAVHAGVLNEVTSDVFGWKYQYIKTENRTSETLNNIDKTQHTQENPDNQTEQTINEKSEPDGYVYTFRVSNTGDTKLRNVTLLDVTTDRSAVEDWGESSDKTTDDGVLSPGERAVVTITQSRPLTSIPEASGIRLTVTEQEEWFWSSIRLCKNILMTLFGAIAAFMTVLCFDTFYRHGRSTIYPIVRITAFAMLAGSLYKGTRAMVLMTALSAALFMTISIRKDAPGVQAANDFINTHLKRNDDEVKNDSGGIILS